MTNRPRRWVALVVAGGLACAPAAASAATPSIPPIHEPFSVLPCTGKPSQRTTMELVACAERQILASDKRIDTLNRAILGHLPDNAAKRRFAAAQKAWLAYRRAYCASRSDVVEGGTLAPLVAANCAVDLNTQHIKDLQAFGAALSGP
jgi:uncharacterized protein YecT (DUF1311 family)